jgi:UDPglucose 6-dehydrogenase
LAGADALVVATEWPDYRALGADAIVAALVQPVVVDANRFLGRTLGGDARIRYAAVGKPA